MTTNSRLNWAKEHEIQALYIPVRDQLSQISTQLGTLPNSAVRADLLSTVTVLSHIISAIDTLPFRLHKSEELPQYEQLIAGTIDFVNKRLPIIIAEVNALQKK